MAVMVHVPALDGAVKRPLLLMEPHEALHVTDSFAENCWVWLTLVLVEDGVMVMGEEMVMLVLAWPLPSLALPVTLQLGCVSGAVKRPVLSMVPQVALHVEAVEAVNCSVAPSLTVGFCGEIE